MFLFIQDHNYPLNYKGKIEFLQCKVQNIPAHVTVAASSRVDVELHVCASEFSMLAGPRILKKKLYANNSFHDEYSISQQSCVFSLETKQVCRFARGASVALTTDRTMYNWAMYRWMGCRCGAGGLLGGGSLHLTQGGYQQHKSCSSPSLISDAGAYFLYILVVLYEVKERNNDSFFCPQSFQHSVKIYFHMCSCY